MTLVITNTIAVAVANGKTGVVASTVGAATLVTIATTQNRGETILDTIQQYHDEIFAAVLIVGGLLTAGLIIYRDIKTKP